RKVVTDDAPKSLDADSSDRSSLARTVPIDKTAKGNKMYTRPIKMPSSVPMKMIGLSSSPIFSKASLTMPVRPRRIIQPNDLTTLLVNRGTTRTTTQKRRHNFDLTIRTKYQA